jgi:NosR/NirI family nitrous oxide reductase transcriptional regulator
MKNLLRRYANWLHLQWPAGTVESLPLVDASGATAIPGVYIVGDLTGVPLLKFAADTGAKAVHAIADRVAKRKNNSSSTDTTLDLVILGAGVAGIAAALEASKLNVRYQVVEPVERLSTIVNFPAGKPIYPFPSDMKPAGELSFQAGTKENLLAELQPLAQRVSVVQGRAVSVRDRGGFLEVEIAEQESLRAFGVIVAIGRSGNFRQLEVPGEDLEFVFNRLHDPKEYRGQKALVVGGGDSAVETAVALATTGASVVLSYRGSAFNRAKPENLTQLETAVRDNGLRIIFRSEVKRIQPGLVEVLDASGAVEQIPVDVVFTMLGREAPLEFFRRSKLPLRGESSLFQKGVFVLFFILVAFIYDWKGDGFFSKALSISTAQNSFPNVVPSYVASLGEWWRAGVADRSTLLGTLAVSMKSRSFYYTAIYSSAILIFGIARIRRRKTPYVTVQTSTLIAIQILPLFLLPELLLPWLGYNGFFDHGWARATADSLFEMYIGAEQYLAHQWPDWGHPRAYWRAYGLILAWPLMVYNVFTDQPHLSWLLISVLQTFVIIPLLVWRFGKGAYCGWICSCGALAETVGDLQREKMPHGSKVNRLNFIGQVVLLCAFILLGLRIAGWCFPNSPVARMFSLLLEGKNSAGELVNPFSYKWLVDVWMGGVLGVGLYFKYSGRVWCRFACPLAALMHIYARFSQFRIFAEKKKCISCNQCTAVCHQGIDIMNFANKGLPMNDPQCVRCSACVQICPTGVLAFGRLQSNGERKLDRLVASSVRMKEH